MNLTHPAEDYVRDCYNIDTAVTNQILCLYDMILNEQISEKSIENIIDQLETGNVHLGIVEETMAFQNIEDALLNNSADLLSYA